MVLKDSQLGLHQSHTDHHLIESIKVGQVLPIHITPHVDGVVNGEPCPANLRHDSHLTVALKV